jgi:hypothetical protein
METERGSPADATPGANVPIPMVTPNSVQNTMVPTHNPLSAAASSGSASDGLPSMPPPLPRLDWAHAADGRGMGRPLEGGPMWVLESEVEARVEKAVESETSRFVLLPSSSFPPPH